MSDSLDARARINESTPVVNLLGVSAIQDEEILIEDLRATLSPVEEVEQKLLRALHASPALVSRLQRFHRPRPR
jgi:hypothetical protein